MRYKSVVVLCGLLLLFFLAATTLNGWAALSVTAKASPGTLNLGQNVTIIVSWNGGTAGGSYTFKVTVTKPGGAWSAYATLSGASNSTGGGNVAVTYPQPTSAWTLVSGTLNTDIEGSYSISVDKTAPNPVQTGAASTSFTVTHLITVTIQSPLPGASFTRGDTVTIAASLTDAQGQPVMSGSARSTTPQSTIGLSQTSTPGTYSAQYQVQLGDPLGQWNVTISGTLVGGNSGSSRESVMVTKAQLLVVGLTTFNAQGNPTNDFSAGDSLYVNFRISYSSSGFLQQGTFNIQVDDPSGGTVATMLATYDSTRALFYTPSGFQISASDAAGAWQLVFPSNSLNDSYRNTGPAVQVDYRFQVHQALTTAPAGLNLFLFAVATLAIGGGLGGGVLVLRQFNETTAPFADIYKLTGGEIPSPVSLMIFGDAGAGTTTLGLQLLFKDLTAGRTCALLSYDAFPSEIRRRMKDMGWEITPYLERGQFTILDVYSALAGVEGSGIKEPTDFTEASIRVTEIMDKAKGPVTLLLDSVTPIFNAASAKDCVNFLQVIAAKVKNSGGAFIFTATKGSIPDDSLVKAEALVDGVIQLSMVRKSNSLARFLMVKKMAGRQIVSTETKFEISTGRGLLLVKQRIPLGFLSRK